MVTWLFSKGLRKHLSIMSTSWKIASLSLKKTLKVEPRSLVDLYTIFIRLCDCRSTGTIARTDAETNVAAKITGNYRMPCVLELYLPRPWRMAKTSLLAIAVFAEHVINIRSHSWTAAVATDKRIKRKDPCWNSNETHSVSLITHILHSLIEGVVGQEVTLLDLGAGRGLLVRPDKTILVAHFFRRDVSLGPYHRVNPTNWRRITDRANMSMMRDRKKAVKKFGSISKNFARPKIQVLMRFTRIQSLFRFGSSRELNEIPRKWNLTSLHSAGCKRNFLTYAMFA